MTTMKFCSIAYQHADWLSKNRLADPVTGCDSDGYLLSALTGGFHANFDSSAIETPADDSGLLLPVVAKSVLTGNALGTASEYMVASTVGTVLVGAAAGPKMLAAPAANGALAIGNNSADMSYVAAVAVGRFVTSGGVATAPKYATAAVSTAAGAITLAGAGVDISYVEPVAKGSLLMSNGANVAPVYSAAATTGQLLVGVTGDKPVWTTVDFVGTTTAGTGEFPVANLTAGGYVNVTLLGDPGTGLCFSHAICDAGKITCYVKDTDSAVAPGGAAAVLASATKICVHVVQF